MAEYFEIYFLGGEFIKDIFLILFGAAISYIAMKIKSGTRLIKIKRGIKRAGVDLSQKGIISLVNSYPNIKKDNIYLTNSDETYKLALPNSEYVKTVNKDILFNNSTTIKQMGEMMGIPEFEDLVNKHKLIVENAFKERKESGRAWFNNEKFGVKAVSFTKTDDANEDSVVSIQFYKTDYFTHKVMRSIYHELKEKGHNIASFSRVEEIGFDKYYPFITSFGIDSLLISNNGSAIPNIFLAKRSKYMANMANDLWHVSMNEGLSITDYDVDNVRNVSWDRCVERGYREELGITNNYHIDENEYCDLFMTKADFEMGVTTVAKIKISLDELNACYQAAEDSSMETLEFKLIPYSRSEIKKIIKEEDITDVLRYSLTMIWNKLI